MAILVSLGSTGGLDRSRWASADDFRPVPSSGRPSMPIANGGFQSSSGDLKPVPKFAGSSVRDPQRHVAASTKPSTHALQWRTSSEVTIAEPPAAAVAAAAPATAVIPPAGRGIATAQPAAQRTLPTAVVIAAPAPTLAEPSQPTPTIRPAGLHSPGSVPRRTTSGAVRQAQFELPSELPPPTGTPQSIPDSLDLPPANDSIPFDLFADPPVDADAAPASPPVSNGLRQPSAPMPDVPAPIPTIPESDQRPSLELQPAPTPPTPRREIEDFQMPRRDEDERPRRPMGAGMEDFSLVRPVAYSCDDFRRSIAEETIQKVSLDISPPFRPDLIEFDEYQKMKRRFDEKQELRDWQSIDGRKLGRGRLRDLAYEKVIIETEFGSTEELPITKISEADLAYVSTQWGLPQECLIDQPQYQPRQWQPSKVTWKASNLIHKPLYFEDVNLERYGHTAGPILQPVVSSAHFFANIAVLPYKMGVHLPGECQYALGYYRPGDCAPWITQPVPLSLRGALFQAGAVTGAVALIP